MRFSALPAMTVGRTSPPVVSTATTRTVRRRSELWRWISASTPIRWPLSASSVMSSLLRHRDIRGRCRWLISPCGHRMSFRPLPADGYPRQSSGIGTGTPCWVEHVSTDVSSPGFHRTTTPAPVGHPPGLRPFSRVSPIEEICSDRGPSTGRSPSIRDIVLVSGQLQRAATLLFRARAAPSANTEGPTRTFWYPIKLKPCAEA